MFLSYDRHPYYSFILQSNFLQFFSLKSSLFISPTILFVIFDFPTSHFSDSNEWKLKYSRAARVGIGFRWTTAVIFSLPRSYLFLSSLLVPNSQNNVFSEIFVRFSALLIRNQLDNISNRPCYLRYHSA